MYGYYLNDPSERSGVLPCIRTEDSHDIQKTTRPPPKYQNENLPFCGEEQTRGKKEYLFSQMTVIIIITIDRSCIVFDLCKKPNFVVRSVGIIMNITWLYLLWFDLTREEEREKKSLLRQDFCIILCNVSDTSPTNNHDPSLRRHLIRTRNLGFTLLFHFANTSSFL